MGIIGTSATKNFENQNFEFQTGLNMFVGVLERLPGFSALFYNCAVFESGSTKGAI